MRPPSAIALAVTFGVASMAAPSVGWAASVSSKEDQNKRWSAFFAGGGESNRLTVAEDRRGRILFTDRGAPLVAKGDCVRLGRHRARCPRPSAEAVASLGNRADRFQSRLGLSARVRGGDGNDVISGGDGDDRLFGGRHNDDMRGDDGADFLNGGGWSQSQPDGNDIMRGGDGDDRLYAGEGNDHVEGRDGADLAWGREGNDLVKGGGGGDWIRGGRHADHIQGRDGADDISGEGGNDLIKGGDGDDSIRGRSGNDNLQGRDGDDYLKGNDANDLLKGGNGADRLRGSNQADHLQGRDGNDDLAGGDGNDRLKGGGGNDTADGEAGKDTVEGRAGADVLRGGDGDDGLDGDDGDDLADGNAGGDFVEGDDGNDRLFAGSDREGDNLDFDTSHGNDRLDGGRGNDLLDAIRADGTPQFRYTQLDCGDGADDARPTNGHQLAMERCERALLWGDRLVISPVYPRLEPDAAVFTVVCGLEGGCRGELYAHNQEEGSGAFETYNDFDIPQSDQPQEVRITHNYGRGNFVGAERLRVRASYRGEATEPGPGNGYVVVDPYD